MAQIELFTQIWVLSTLGGLLIGSYYDMKQRWIPDKVAAIQSLLGLLGILLWLQRPLSFFTTVLVVFNVLFGIIIFIVIMITGLSGLGDAKLIFATSVSYPVYSELFPLVFTLDEQFPPIFSILLNFMLMHFVLIIGIIIYNLVQYFRFGRLFENTEGTLTQKLFLVISGMYIETRSLENRKYYNPGETYTEELGWQLYTKRVDMTLEDEEIDRIEKEEQNTMKEDIQKTGKELIWIVPQPPGIVLLLISFILTVLIGTPLGGLLDLVV